MESLADRAELMLKPEITPETLWDLTPWSWAVDWFSSFGDVLHNVGDWAKDGLVMKYGYVMEHSSVTDAYTWAGPSGFISRVNPTPLTVVSETKQRRKATPFGFGLTWSAFTKRQAAILVALGITKGRD